MPLPHDLEAIREETGSVGVPQCPGMALSAGHLTETATFALGMEAPQVTPGRARAVSPSDLNGGGALVACGDDATTTREGVLESLAQLREEFRAPTFVTPATSLTQKHELVGETELLPADAETAVGELRNSFHVLGVALGDLQRDFSAHKISATQQVRTSEEAINAIGKELAEFREHSSTLATLVGFSQSFERLQSSMAALTDRVSSLEQLQPGEATIREIPQNYNHCEPAAALAEQVAELHKFVDDLKSGQAELGQDIGDIVGVLSHSSSFSSGLPMITSIGGTSGDKSEFGNNFACPSGQVQELRKKLSEHRHEHLSRIDDEIHELVEMLNVERQARICEIEELRASFLAKASAPDIARGENWGTGEVGDNATDLPAAMVALHMALAKELRSKAVASEAAASAFRVDIRSELSQHFAMYEEVLLRLVSMAESVRNEAVVDTEVRRSPVGEKDGGGYSSGLTQGGLVSSTEATEIPAAGTPAHAGAPSAGRGSRSSLLVTGTGAHGNAVAAVTASRTAPAMLVGTFGSEAVTHIRHIGSRCPRSGTRAQMRISIPSAVALAARSPSPPFGPKAAASSTKFTQLSSPAVSPDAARSRSGAATPGWPVPPTCASGVPRIRSPTRSPYHPLSSVATRPTSPVRAESLRNSLPIPCGT